MKKLYLITLVLCLFLGGLSCNKSQEEPMPMKEEGKEIVAPAKEEDKEVAAPAAEEGAGRGPKAAAGSRHRDQC